MGYLNCDSRLYIPADVITGIKAALLVPEAEPVTDPGFAISFTNVPKFSEGPNGRGNAGIWTVAGEIRHNGVLRSVEIPGLKASLAAA